MQPLDTDTLEEAHNRVRLELMHYAQTKHGKRFFLDAVHRLITIVEGTRLSSRKTDASTKDKVQP